jgi:hypothetical protein
VRIASIGQQHIEGAQTVHLSEEGWQRTIIDEARRCDGIRGLPGDGVMRILFAIPHYFAQADAPANYGSERTAPEARAGVVRRCVASLWQTFSEAQSLADGLKQQFVPANPRLAASITVALCTTGDSHLVADLAGCPLHHVSTKAEPRFLGFECHKVLRSGLGQFDYFGYLEDDLRIDDGLFFVKLAWFNAQFGEAALLQPNRFEISDDPVPYKVYIDGNPHDQTLLSRQRGDGEPRLTVAAIGRPMAFQRVNNPHSGCFFLSAAQLARWIQQPDFAEPSAAFAGPLESAATLGIMRHFRVYKPARENAAFLEIEHLDPRYLGRRYIPIAGDPPTLERSWDLG